MSVGVQFVVRSARQAQPYRATCNREVTRYRALSTLSDRRLPAWSSRNADAWPLLACGATLSLDGLREVRFPIRADFHNAARLEQLHARDETAGGSPIQQRGETVRRVERAGGTSEGFLSPGSRRRGEVPGRVSGGARELYRDSDFPSPREDTANIATTDEPLGLESERGRAFRQGDVRGQTLCLLTGPRVACFAI